MTPYTPEALARMRAGASASDLGWDEKTYRERCRRHGIEPVVSVKVAEASVVQVKAVEPAATPVAMVPDPPPGGPAPPIWNRKAGELARGRKAVALTPRQADVFDRLFVAYGRGLSDERHPIGSIELAHGNNRTALQVPSVVLHINAKIRPMGITIAGRKGHGGGYWLKVE